MTKTPSLDRLAFMLALLSAIGPFAIDAYLPAFLQIAATLGATQLEVQQTLTVYMAALALMVLWHGALADRFGRRRVLLLLTAVFAVASLMCALAPSIEWLWVGRARAGAERARRAACQAGLRESGPARRRGRAPLPARSGRRDPAATGHAAAEAVGEGVSSRASGGAHAG